MDREVDACRRSKVDRLPVEGHLVVPGVDAGARDGADAR